MKTLKLLSGEVLISAKNQLLRSLNTCEGVIRSGEVAACSVE